MEFEICWSVDLKLGIFLYDPWQLFWVLDSDSFIWILDLLTTFGF